MGALVVFNLGDRDLVPAEVVWAMQVVQDNRSRLGVDPSLPSRGAVGSYASSMRGQGFHYEHPDHVAIADALLSTDLHLGPQLGATASDDPRAVVTGVVSEQAMLTAFGPENSFGAHANRYGWLWRDDDDPILHRRVDAYQVDRTGQCRLLHCTQHF